MLFPFEDVLVIVRPESANGVVTSDVELLLEEVAFVRPSNTDVVGAGTVVTSGVVVLESVDSVVPPLPPPAP